MKKIGHYGLTTLFVICCLIFMGYPISADDTCVFSVTADDLPPNIVLLLDSGAEMEQVVWHKEFNNSTDYTPADGTEMIDGFYNDTGYGIILGDDGYYYLVDVPENLEILNHTVRLPAQTSDTLAQKGTWKINGREITLPAQPYKKEVDGVIDNARYFRYSKNYLNWLFFSDSYVADGTDLPDVSRFYYAKKAIMTVAKGTGFKAKFGMYYFSNDRGASQAQPLKFVVNTEGLTPEFKNNINNMRTVTYSPLAEGLSTVGYYYSSPSSGASGGYCQSNFTIVISPGVSSEDQGPTSQNVPKSLLDYDEDGGDGGIGEGYIMEDNTRHTIPVNQNGSTYLDDVAYYLYSHDIVGDAPSIGSLCFDGLNNYKFDVNKTVTGGSSKASGNITAVNLNAGGTSGCLELDNLSGYFLNDEILSVAGSSVSAYVNGTLYTEGQGFQNMITYTIGFMGDKEGELFLINTSNNGNGSKNLYDTADEDYGKYHFTAGSPDGLSAQLLEAVGNILSRTSTFMAPVVPVTRTTSGDRIYMAFFKPGNENFWEGNVTKYGISADNDIVDANGNPATWPNGAMRDDAVPYWATIDWADITKSNGIHNSSRTIWTCLDGQNLIPFTDANLSAPQLGGPIRPKSEIINYVRGADVLDEDGDTDTSENRSIITGDVLHSEPVIFQYRETNGDSTTMVYFGANDGMLHAVLDTTQSSGADPVEYGTEEWAFIPPDQLPRLKDMIEGFGHQSYVDATPKIYFKDIDRDGVVDTGDGDQVILVCGERKGGTGYFALDVTNPSSPQFLWTINQSNIPELGETWSEPQFGKVKTSAGDTVGTPVFFVGGGYHETNSKGRTVLAVNVSDGSVLKQFVTGSTPYMNYAIPSSVLVVDEDDNGFTDKVYVGDLGGQMWRFGGVTANDFDNFNENINEWTAQVFFKTDSGNSRKFFYPPSVTLEKGYDMVFMGTGDRDNACCNNDTFVCSSTGPDIIAAVKDTHSLTTIVGETDLVDVTDPTVTPPDLTTDQGWYVRLVDDNGSPVGEKVLAEGVVFYKTFYITTFTPNEDPCVPGGDAKLYALSHLTGKAVLDFDGDGNHDRSVILGGGIPSKPVMLITKTGIRLLISVGSSNPISGSASTGAGVLNITPLLPPVNFFYKFWMEN